MRDDALIAKAVTFHPWDAMAPPALHRILERGPFQNTVETGCGGSTIVLSHASDRHWVFAVDGDDCTISELRKRSELRQENVVFIEGETCDTLPTFRFDRDIDLALLDGPHAYPLPQIEFAYLFPKIRLGGWLVLDDIQIRSVHQLFQFLREERSVVLEEVIVRSAFFRRTQFSEHKVDGWNLQGINKNVLLRYTWRDRLRKLLIGSSKLV